MTHTERLGLPSGRGSGFACSLLGLLAPVILAACGGGRPVAAPPAATSDPPAATPPAGTSFDPERFCDGARAFFTNNMMVMAVVDPDTIQDWRTRKTVLGCRVYAADASDLDMNGAARTFYERLATAGWTRTPDAQDMPNEAAIRLRKDGVDCLYHVYRAPLINTAGEVLVTTSIALQPGQVRYNLLVQCMAAEPAAVD